MGHIRLGRLPKTRPWRGVVALLAEPSTPASEIAASVSLAARAQLDQLARDRGTAYCFFVLVRIAQAARQGKLDSELRRLGAPRGSLDSPLLLARAISQLVEEGMRVRGNRTPVSRMAELALRDTLNKNLIARSQTLFGSGQEEIQAAARKLGGQAGFAEAARGFFADLTARVVRFVVDKEVSNHVGPGRRLAAPGDVADFHEALGRYCFEASKIVEAYAGGWFSKKKWETGDDISQGDVTRFAAYAFQKLQAELREGAA